LGLAACQKGLSVGFITAAALVHELIEARDDKRLLRLQCGIRFNADTDSTARRTAIR
jgi:DNA replication protein DnaC